MNAYLERDQAACQAVPAGRAPLGWRAASLAVLLSTLWGGLPVALKIGLRDAPPFRLGWMRFILGGMVVLGWALASRQSLRLAPGERRPLLFLGLLFSLQLACLNLGQDHTTAGHAAVIGSSFPLWTGVIAHLFVPGDRLSRRRLLGTLIAYAGVVVVFSGSLGGDGASLLGDGLLLSSAMLLGVRQVYISQRSQGIGLPKLLIAQSAVGIVTFVTASHLFEPQPYRWTPSLGASLVYQGVVIAGFAFIGQVWLLKHYYPSRVTALFLTQPIFGVLFSGWILGERIGPELYLGAALVVVGSFLAQRRE